jgi:hypothetical protein
MAVLIFVDIGLQVCCRQVLAANFLHYIRFDANLRNFGA